MVDGQTETTSWEVALERLQHPAPGQNHWLATVRSDGAPHLMPIIAFWIDGAFHFLVGPSTRKGRNLAADERCVIGTGNLTTPSLDLIVEGRNEPISKRLTEIRARWVAASSSRSGPIDAPALPDARPPALPPKGGGSPLRADAGCSALGCYGVPGRIRTCDPLLRRQPLCPLSYGDRPKCTVRARLGAIGLVRR